MMNRIRASKFVDFKWGGFALFAMLSVITLSGRVAFSASEPGGASGAATLASTGVSTGSVTEVKIDNFVFAPGEVTVKAGTQVSWINRDDIPHTVDSTQGKFKSAALDTNDKFQFRFSEPGEYPFYCRMHPKMTGKIIVQP